MRLEAPAPSGLLLLGSTPLPLEAPILLVNCHLSSQDTPVPSVGPPRIGTNGLDPPWHSGIMKSYETKPLPQRERSRIKTHR